VDASTDTRDELLHASRRRRAVTLAVGLALLAAALAATLSHAAKRRTATNDVITTVAFAAVGPGTTICQRGERIPSGTGAIRVTLEGARGAATRFSLTLSERGAIVASSRTVAGQEGAGIVRIPLAQPLRREVTGSVCVGVLPDGSPAAQYRLLGAPSDLADGTRVDGAPVAGRLRLEFLAAGGGSWWSFAPTVARRMGLGHAWSGPTVALLALALTLTSIAAGAWQVVRGER